MAAPDNELAFSLEAAIESGKRWAERAERRGEKLQGLREGGVMAAESAERVAKRANRLLDKVRQAMPVAPTAVPPTLRELVDRGPLQPHELTPDFAERIIGETRDFLSVYFIERAQSVIRSVGRIVTRLGGGRVSYGTGFMVSPRLLLTNHHVLPRKELAAETFVEFNYELDGRQNPRPVVRFKADPDTFFLNDQAFDFALVAVQPTSGSRALSEFGFLPLINEEGKALIGNPVNIVQHPKGEMKQVALRENKLVDLPEETPFAHYACDTERGSSGSSVFNDEWEVIALHHSAIPKMDDQNRILDIDGNVWPANGDPDRIFWVSNEGIRISRLTEFLKEAQLDDEKKKLLRDQLFSAPANEAAVVIANERPKRAATRRTPMHNDSDGHPAGKAACAGGPQATLTIPVTISVTIGEGGTPAIAGPQPASSGTPPAEVFTEAVKPDPDYSTRPGYQEDFLAFAAPLPALTAATQGHALLVDSSATNPYELKYYHYSVMMNETRKLAYVSAVNIDPEAPFQWQREGKDTWFYDPRIDKQDQAGDALYSNNPLDRGHLTRRADAAWGESEEEARLANDDTFHWSNCSPQHEVFNQSALGTKKGMLLWGNIENHIAEQAKKDERKLSVFNGPIFRDNDRKYRGIKLPREFWKVVVFKNDDDEPRALAFVLSQAELIKNLPAEEFEVGPYGVYQVSLAELEKKTGLSFAALAQFEPQQVNDEEGFAEFSAGSEPLQSLNEIRA